jgi:transposase-like protein
MNLSRFFLEPSNTTHRQYEALRAYFVEGVSSKQAARRFGYTPGSFRVLCHQFRHNPQRSFFLSASKGPKTAPKRDPVRDRVVALRKQNLSIYDISRALSTEGRSLSPVSVSAILKEEGFARLPRRRDEERLPTTRPVVADVADVRELNLEPRSFRTAFGGLFLFLPYLAQIPFGRIIGRAGLPGSKMIPAAHAVRSLLALKLFGNARHSHVMSYVLDEGLGLFAGLNRTPKRAFLTEYSCRIHPGSYPKLMRGWFGAVKQLGLQYGESFDLDFHTIPFHGQDALVQKHYVTKRSRRQKGVVAFVAQDASNRVFCYVNGDIRKDKTSDEILAFVQYWKKRTGHVPGEVIFDSQLTTQANMDKLTAMGVDFITLRRRSEKMLAEIYAKPPSAWRQIHLQGISRIYRTPRIIDEKISLRHYTKPIRQITIKDLGHEEPTVLLTNQSRRSAATLVERYARRMIIENGIADAIDFFHMDALSSAVAMKVNCDLTLTLMASSLYRLLGCRIGNGYEVAKSRHIFRDFVQAAARVIITDKEVVVRFQKRAHNPLLLAAGFGQTDIPIPWLGRRRLRLQIG